MRLEPFRVFFALALLSIVALAWITSPYLSLVFFYAALAGWLWNEAPLWFESPLPKVAEILPIGLLVLFMMVLSGSPTRSTSEALVYTAGALILFRGIIFLLVRIRNSKKPVPNMAKAVIVGFLFQLVLNAIHVYSTFRAVSPNTLLMANSLSNNVLMLILMAGWFSDLNLSKRERFQGGWMFAAGAIGYYPYLAGSMLILNTIFFLRERKFTYEIDADEHA